MLVVCQILFVVDPLSVAGQRAAAVIQLFRDQLRFSQVRSSA